MQRLLFISDIHGSTLVLIKAVAFALKYNCDALIIAGDLTGKEVRLIVTDNHDTYTLFHRGDEITVTAIRLKEILSEFKAGGIYFHEVSSEEAEFLSGDIDSANEILVRKAAERLKEWGRYINASLDTTKCQVVITPGNDDDPLLDEVLTSLKRKGILSSSALHLLGGYELFTVPYTPPSPWRTPREITEEELYNYIKDKVGSPRNPRRTIFNFHAPPLGTALDLAPEIDTEKRPVITPGADNRTHVGSYSVLKIIKELQPRISLHGHIHESPGAQRIGNTWAFNPGSSYWNGSMHGYFIELDTAQDKIKFKRVII